MGFNEWMTEVNKRLDEKVSLTAIDLPDWDYRVAYDKGISPAQAAKEALIDAGLQVAVINQLRRLTMPKQHKHKKGFCEQCQEYVTCLTCHQQNDLRHK